MNASPLVHSRMLAGLERSGFFPAIATVQVLIETRTPAGDVVPAWTTRPGMDAVPCRRAVPSATAGRNEVRGRDMAVVEHNDYVIVLAAYLPAISAKDRVVLDSGEVYDVMVVNHDSASAHTSLEVRTVKPVAEAGV